MRFVWVLLITVAMWGCQEKCTPQNCSGCCAADGVCAPGTARLECGRGGESCSACTQGARCFDQTCFLEPEMDAGVDAGPPTCKCRTSCCLPDGSCAPNNDPGACGPSMQFCGTCQSGFRCEFGVCTAAPCNGCFDPLGICRPGTDDGSCGSDGGVCVSCGVDQQCSNKRCVFTRCDFDNCRFGCCHPDLSCEPNPGAMACGLSGAPCVTCMGAEMCIGGQCL